jgi:hypothetical protein
MENKQKVLSTEQRTSEVSLRQWLTSQAENLANANYIKVHLTNDAVEVQEGDTMSTEDTGRFAAYKGSRLLQDYDEGMRLKTNKDIRILRVEFNI